MKDLLDIKEIKEFFAPGNQLDSYFVNYEYRPQQQKMAETITEVLNQKKHLLVEAGTGTGKSLAYLVPVILLAVKNEEQVVISTNTINLQEQLIKKDIPLLQKVFDFGFKSELVKGRRNYICLRRLMQYENSGNLSAEDYEVLTRINQWVLETETGSRSDLNFKVDFQLWEKISSQSDLCLRGNCPYYEQCHFIFAREKAKDADLLVVNHHLLFADLALRENNNLDNEVAVLPPYKKLICDEAHNIEDVATSYLGFNASRKGIIKLLKSIYDLKENKGLLLEIKLLASSLKDEDKVLILEQIHQGLIPLVKKVIELGQALFDRLIAFVTNEKKGRQRKLRITDQVREEEMWQDLLLIDFENFLVNLNKLIKELKSLSVKLFEGKDETENFELLDMQLDAKIDFISDLNSHIEELVAQPKEDYVYWIEAQGEDCSLHNAPLNIACQLQKSLFDKMDSVILTSATLVVNNSFEFIRGNLGLSDYPIETLQVGSPFDYRNQLQIGVVKNISNPNSLNFRNQIADKIKEVIKASRGRSLILFTSYSMLNLVYYNLVDDIDRLGIKKLYRQGMKSRQYLVEELKANDNSVLLGTTSFWEGVDIPGDKLSCVIIVKLPFLVPDEPVVAAKIERFNQAGENSFFKYMLPKAVIKFKQGVGRLIRTKSDKGWVVLFDNRIINKSYGNVFLKSLPCNSQILINDLNLLLDKIRV